MKAFSTSFKNSSVLVKATALAVALSGFLLLSQSIILRFAILRRFDMLTPFGWFHFGRLVRFTLGFSLLYLSLNLNRRKRTAWILAVALSTLTFILQTLADVEPTGIFVTVLTLVVLVWAKDEFYVLSEPTDLLRGLRLSLWAIALAMLYGTIGFFFVNYRDFHLHMTLPLALKLTAQQTFLTGGRQLVPHTRDARWFMQSLDLAGLLSIGLVIMNMFRPLRERLARPHETDQMAAILKQHGHSVLDLYKIWPAKSYLFSSDHQAAVAFGVAGGVALAIEGPVAPPSRLAGMIKEFDDYCQKRGYIPAFLEADEAMAKHLAAAGYRTIKLAQVGFIDLEGFYDRLPRDLRYSARRFSRHGYSLEHYQPPHSRTLLAELHQISDQWLSLPGKKELGFILPHFDRYYLDQCQIFVLRNQQGQPVAFGNILPEIGHNHGQVLLEMARYRPDAENSTPEAMIVMIMQALEAAGYKRFTMGGTFLAGMTKGQEANLEEKVLYQLNDLLGKRFFYQGLGRFKDKFKPEYEPRYLAYRGTLPDLVKVGLAFNALSKLPRFKR